MHRANFISVHDQQAAADPAACVVCHSELFCVDCHTRLGISGQNSARGNPHPPGWSGPPGSGNTHGPAARLDPLSCASCHGGAGEVLCVSCHQVGGPGGNPHPPGFNSRLEQGQRPTLPTVSRGWEMKRAAITIGVFAVLGFLGGFLFAKLSTNVVPTIKEQREAGPTRTVPDTWREVRLSPGHSQHVVNERIECNECHDPGARGLRGPRYRRMHPMPRRAGVAGPRRPRWHADGLLHLPYLRLGARGVRAMALHTLPRSLRNRRGDSGACHAHFGAVRELPQSAQAGRRNHS